MFRRRQRHDVPALNTTSTADISFMLLIFFLVTSSMDTDKGLLRQLPPHEEEQAREEVTVKKRNIMALQIDADNRLTCNGDTISLVELTQRVKTFVANVDDDPLLPEKTLREVHLLGTCRVSDRHVITIQANRHSTYDAYFNMQNAIVRGYALLRDQLARKCFGHGYALCSQDERDAVTLVYPQRISEMAEEGEEGGEP